MKTCVRFYKKQKQPLNSLSRKILFSSKGYADMFSYFYKHFRIIFLAKNKKKSRGKFSEKYENRHFYFRNDEECTEKLQKSANF
jgi:hypothetical protein